MKNKYKFISILFIVFFLSLSFVSASDFDNETMSAENTEIISASTNFLTFKDLQQTINDAEDGDTIILNDNYINDENNPYSLTIKKSLTLDGNGKTLDGNYVGTILYINADNVTLKNLNFINGKAANSGAISWAGNDGTIDSCTFENNIATQYISGAVYWAGNGGTIINSKFTGNTAPSSGGGIRIDGNNFKISNNNFERNSAYNLGGGMIIIGNDNTITKNNFTSNYANSSGGGFRIEGNRSVIKDNNFYNNVAEVNLGGGMISLGNHTYIENNIFKNNKAGRDGGGITIEGYVFTEDYSIPGINNTVINNIFTNNTATYGGAISIYCRETSIIANKFSDNYASELGGALRWAGGNDAVDIEIIDNTFNDNYADVSGGAIFASCIQATIRGNNFTNHKSTNKNEESGGSGGTLTIHGPNHIITNNSFKNGNATNYGGAIFANGSNMDINKNTFENNIASNANGGAVYVSGDATKITDNEFKTNKAGNYGGAIFTTSNNAVISNNILTSNDAVSSGGAIYTLGDNVNIESNQITGNTAENVGGAIGAIGDKTTIKDNTITKNTATKNGGAIYLQGSQTTITNNKFEENTAETAGGAIQIDGNTQTITDNQFTKNTAKTFGGAINSKGDNIDIKNNIFTENTATTSGGAIYSIGTNTKIENNEITKNKAENNVGGAINVNGDKTTINNNTITKNTATKNGGAIYLRGNQTTITTNTFTENTAGTGGGAMQIEGNTQTITDNKFTNNNAKTIGGAINSNGNNVEILNNIFNNNNATTSGGAIYSIGTNTKIENNQITKNNALNNVGGAINANGDKTTINNNTITKNTATKNGGAIYLRGNQTTITTNTFTENTAGTGGGAIQIEGNTQTITDNKFTNNNAKTIGGAINSNGNNVEILNNIFNNNNATTSGGAIYSIGTNTKIENNQITKNNALNNVGGAINVNGDKTTINNNTITKNTATKNGGAIYLRGNQTTITTNTFEENTAGTAGGVIQLEGNTQTITDNQFTKNTANTYGGAINSKGDNVEIQNNIFDNNKASTSGGAINSEGKTTIKNNEFNKNSATSNMGGAISLNGDKSIISDNDFNENTAKTGGAVSATGKETQIANNLFYKNQAEDTAGALRLNGDKSTINNNTFKENTAKGFGAGAYVQGNDITASNNILTNNNAGSDKIGGALRWSGDNAKIIKNTFRGNTAKTGTAIYGSGANVKINENTMLDSTLGDTSIRWDGNNQDISNNIYEPFNSTVIINMKDGDIYYGTSEIIIATLTDGNSNPVASVPVTLTIADKSYALTTDSNGQVFLDVSQLKTGTNKVNVKFKGNSDYKSAEATSTITLKSTIEANDLTADYASAVYTAKFLDSQGKALTKGTYVSFTIGNETIRAQVDANGVATIKIEQNAGKYTITNINTVTGETSENKITINSLATTTKLTGVKDIEVGETLTLTADVNASAGIVTFNLNGQDTVVDLTNGKAVLKLSDLAEGSYTVTATYSDVNKNYKSSSDKGSFEVTGKQTKIKMSDVTQYYGGNETLVITLTDSSSKPLAKREITLTLNGETYPLTTDAKGQTSVDLGQLPLGTYTAAATFAGDDENSPASRNATVYVKSTIESEDVTADYGNVIYTAKFLDSKGTPLAKGTYVSFTIGNEAIRAQVDANGVATLTVNEVPGKYGVTNTNPATGETTENKITIKQAKTSTTLSGVTDIEIGNKLTVTASVNATEGSVTFKVNKNETTVNLTNGKAKLDLNNLEAGSYTVTATYKDAKNNYLSSSDSASFKVTKKDNKITVKVADIKEDEDAVFNVTTTAPNGKVTLTINKQTYTENLTNGKATFTVSNLTSGDYPYKVTFEDDYYYASNSTEGTLNVKSDNIIIDAPDLTKYYGAKDRFQVKVTDKDGNPLSNITIQIVLNGVTYNRNTDANGIAGMNIGLGSGNYTALVIYAGDAEHSATNVTAKITVLATVFGDDVTKIQRGPEPYYATFLDSTGKVLADGTTVQFNINGVLYDRVIKDGKGRLNLNLESGTYIITAINPVTGENAANNITIKPRIINNSDVTKFYRNGTQYYVTILGDDGKAVGAGVTVKFNINGVFYERQTNASGVARLNLNLEPGKYIITAEYNGCRVSNNITVLPVLSAKDITMTYRDGTKFKATLVDGTGAPYPGEKVTFNINGVFYDRVTDENGIAALNINLMPGKYIITSSYNGANIANNVTIKA